jgi:hypothetical protein
MLLAKHINDGAARLRVQIKWPVSPTSPSVCHHAHSSMDLSAKDHNMVLPCHQGSILTPFAWPATTTTNVEVGLLHLFHKSNIVPRIPGIEPTQMIGLMS